MMNTCDVVVIGTGVALSIAFNALSKGLKVALAVKSGIRLSPRLPDAPRLKEVSFYGHQVNMHLLD